MKFNFIPYYIELLDQPIPGTDRKTQNMHVLLFGLVKSFELTNKTCYAKAEWLAEKLNSTKGKIEHIRADLIKIGWLIPTRNKYGEIVELSTPELEFITPTTDPQVSTVTPTTDPQVNGDCPTGQYGTDPQVNSTTEERPQSYKINNIEKIRMSLTPPFNPSIKEEPTCVRLMPNDRDAKRRRSFAILSGLYTKFGWRGKPTAVEANNLTAALDAGRTVAEIESAIAWMEQHEYWRDKSPKSKLADEPFKQYDAFVRAQKNKQSPDATEADPDRQKGSGYQANMERLRAFNREQLKDVL